MDFGRKIFPDKSRLTFDGGKNNKFERSIIADNESPDCLNVVFSNGAVETRQGIAKLNSTSRGSFAIDGLYTRHTNAGAETMIVFCGDQAFTWSGSTFSTIPSGQSVMTNGFRVAAAEYENHMFFGNGQVLPYKYNGTDFTRHGVYPPTATSTVASNANGYVTGAVQYKVTYVNSMLAEGDLGPATTTFSAASATMRLTAIPVAPQSWGVNYRRVYRLDSGAASYKRVATISDNTTTTYDDNTPTASLGATAPSDNGLPPNYSAIIYFKDRLFVNDPANPNYVWFSGLGEPYTFASTDFRLAGDNSFDLVRGFGVHNDSLYIFCENSISMIYMPDTDDANWKVVKVNSAYGSKSPFCMLNINEEILFPAMQNSKFVGFASVKGNATSPSATLLTIGSQGSDLVSDRIEPDIFTIPATMAAEISGIVFKNRAWIALAYGSGQTTNNYVYQYDFSIENLSTASQPAWAPFSGWTPRQFTIYDGKLYFSTSAANGYVWQAEAGVYNDDSSAINSYYWTKEFGGASGDFITDKDFRYANILVENVGSYYMNLTYRVNSDAGAGTTKQIDLTPGGSLWGVMTWGTDSWGGGSNQAENRVYLDGARGKRIQFKFSNQNTANQRFKVHSLNFLYNVKGLR